MGKTTRKTKNTVTAEVAVTVDSINHKEATRKNIATAEQESFVQEEVKQAIVKAYQYRNADLDPQLVWRGKEIEDWSDLIVSAPPLYIQEKVHPKALIDDLLRQSKTDAYTSGRIMADLFSDFNGIPQGVDKTEFYRHDQHWSNRMILGDSLQVMASLAEREGLRGKVQCIYFDPPYGIKFNSNFQWSTTSRDVKDGNASHITREAEQVKAFRDTWRDGIHSYLSYLRDRLTVARDLLAESGSIFIQIGDENVHRVRAVVDEVFGEDNYISTINFATTSGFTTSFLSREGDLILWYAKKIECIKAKSLFRQRIVYQEDELYKYVEESNGAVRLLTDVERFNPKLLPKGARVFRVGDTSSQGASATDKEYFFRGKLYKPSSGRHWTPGIDGLRRWDRASRIATTEKYLTVRRYADDNVLKKFTSNWTDTGTGSFTDDKVYVVQTNVKVIQRCILMATDPGDLVLDPTCGSGTTAYVSEQWGRRWITIDTSRVSLALARARIMGARYPWYILADSREGQLKEAEISRTVPSTQPVYGSIRQGFVYERVPHITLKSIANNTEIDVIWDKWQQTLEPLRDALNKDLGTTWEEWEIPRDADSKWKEKVKQLHTKWWERRIARQKEIDASIAAKAEYEYLYDKPYVDKSKVRVAGPFTVESLSPHRSLGMDENDELIDPLKTKSSGNDPAGFAEMILENLKTAGVQQAHKEDKIDFTGINGWPGSYICAEGRYMEGDIEKRAGIFVGPEFGTVQRADLVSAAREAGDAGFDVLVSCAFNYEALTTEFNKLGRIPVLKARINADMHMAGELKNTGKGNLFVIFGEPDIDIISVPNNMVQVKIKGVDVFHPNTGEVRSDNADGIACWFIDTDYNEESFFVRHAYFLGAQDPYNALKTTLKSEINPETWSSLNSDTSRLFPKPSSGRIAVKVINHLGDEVMKVFKVQ